MLVSAKVDAHTRDKKTDSRPSDEIELGKGERPKGGRGDSPPPISFCHKLPVFYYLK